MYTRCNPVLLRDGNFFSACTFCTESSTFYLKYPINSSPFFGKVLMGKIISHIKFMIQQRNNICVY